MNKTYKYMTAILNIVCINKLPELVDEYNNTIYNTNIYI